VSPMRPRLEIGHIGIDVMTFAEALDEIERLVIAGQGGMVFTPNVDHVVNAQSNLAFRHAYQSADLTLVDGQPLVWASRLLGNPLPEKISGSDLVMPLLRRAAHRGWRVYLLGAGPGVAERAAKLLREKCGVNVVGTSAPTIEIGNTAENARVAARMRLERPDLVLVALGSPKQELFIHQVAAEVKPAVLLGIGASLDFMVGAAKRAPQWMSRAGLEWLYRLAREPRRMWRRYLVNDVKFFGVLLRDVQERAGR
jgi:N-acetylglucosaminyldiphosphoundecaprenol N-acetyl-beta-D-mannosaminyltransferase